MAYDGQGPQRHERRLSNWETFQLRGGMYIIPAFVVLPTLRWLYQRLPIDFIHLRRISGKVCKS